MPNARDSLKELYLALHQALGADSDPDDEQIRALTAQVSRVARILETQAVPGRLPRIRRGPAESPTMIEPPTFPGPKKRL